MKRISRGIVIPSLDDCRIVTSYVQARAVIDRAGLASVARMIMSSGRIDQPAPRSQRDRTMPVPPGLYPMLGHSRARSCCPHAATKDQGPTAAPANEPLTCPYLVAGAGFEP